MGTTFHIRRAVSVGLLTAIFAVGALGACDRLSKPEVVAASPTAITIRSNRLTEPKDMADAHCKAQGKKAVARGAIKLGEPAYALLYGYDCVAP